MADDFDDSFDDDGTLDTLGVHELEALEKEAVRSTQQWANTQAAQRARTYTHPPAPQYQQRQQFPQRNFTMPANFRHQPNQLPTPDTSRVGQYDQNYGEGPGRPQQYTGYSASQREPGQVNGNGQYGGVFAHPQSSARGSAYGQTYNTDTTLPYTTVPTVPIPNQYGQAPSQKPPSDYGDFEFEEEVELLDSVAPTNAGKYQGLRGISTGQTVDNNPTGDEYQQDEFRDITQGNYAELSANGNYAGGEQTQGYDQIEYAQAQVQGQEGVDIQRLQDMVAQYQSERASLLDQLEKAKAHEISKAGEVSIVRENMKKAAKDHERIVTSLKNAQAAQKDKHDKELEGLRDNMKKLETDMVFLKKEVDELTQRNKMLESKNRALEKQRANAQKYNSDMDDVTVGGTTDLLIVPEQDIPVVRSTTPKKKGKSYAYRDGFDDSEVIRSPSKRGKPRTPTKTGAKRKRSVHESPVMELPMEPVNAPPPFMEPEEKLPMVDGRILDILWTKGQDDRAKIFDAILIHRYPDTGQRSLDALSNISFLSSPGATVSGYLFDQLATAKPNGSSSAFMAAFCKVLLSVWERCLQEGCYAAISILLDLLRFCILWSSGSFCFDIMDTAVSVLQNTVDINAIPMFKKHVSQLHPEIDVTACLTLLQDIAFYGLADEQSIQRFWRLVRSDFPLVLLNLNQPIPHITAITSLLCTSVFDKSFGPSNSNEETQRRTEDYLIETVTKVLIDTPKLLITDPPYTALQLLRLRSQVLQFLGCLLTSESGKRALLGHPHAVQRIARRLAEELDELYEWRRGQEERTTFVNNCVRLLHGMVVLDQAVVRGRLVGGMAGHRYLVAMARVAFAEGNGQERGLEEDVMMKAHELLEGVLTPDEAEELWGVLESAAQ